VAAIRPATNIGLEGNRAASKLFCHGDQVPEKMASEATTFLRQSSEHPLPPDTHSAGGTRRPNCYRLRKALSRQPIKELDSNGFLSRQTAPAAVALASNPGSARAVIIMTGSFDAWEPSS
jgi:hypothetical protein